MESLFPDVAPSNRRSRRTLPLNESAFDEPSEAAHYWAGFLMADGCIAEDGGTPKVALRLAAQDRGHVESFRAFLGSGHAVISGHCSSDQLRQFNGAKTRRGQYDWVHYSVRSRQLVAALATFGITPRKTLVARFLGGLEFSRHAWRGVIDGDGTLGLHSMGRKRFIRPALSLVGSEPLVRQFAEFAKAVAECSLSLQPRGRVWKVQLSCNTAYLIAKELYKECTIALPRKFVIAQEIVRRGPIEPYHKDWSWLTAARLQRLYIDHGENWTAVGRTLGVSFSTLREMREWRGMSVERTLRDWSNLTSESLVGLRSRLPSWSAVARRLGLCPSNLRHIRRRLGVE